MHIPLYSNFKAADSSASRFLAVSHSLDSFCSSPVASLRNFSSLTASHLTAFNAVTALESASVAVCSSLSSLLRSFEICLSCFLPSATSFFKCLAVNSL